MATNFLALSAPMTDRDDTPLTSEAALEFAEALQHSHDTRGDISDMFTTLSLGIIGVLKGMGEMERRLMELEDRTR